MKKVSKKIYRRYRQKLEVTVWDDGEIEFEIEGYPSSKFAFIALTKIKAQKLVKQLQAIK